MITATELAAQKLSQAENERTYLNYLLFVHRLTYREVARVFGLTSHTAINEKFEKELIPGSKMERRVIEFFHSDTMSGETVVALHNESVRRLIREKT